MASQIRVTIESVTETGEKSKVVFDSEDYKFTVEGKAYPWIMTSLVEWYHKFKDNIAKPKPPEKPNA